MEIFKRGYQKGDRVLLHDIGPEFADINGTIGEFINSYPETGGLCQCKFGDSYYVVEVGSLLPAP